MALHRDILRGAGFWHTLNHQDETLSDQIMADMTLEDAAPPPPRPAPVRSLPSFDYFAIGDPVLRSASLKEALPEDQVRLEKYGSNRPLGIFTITAPVSGSDIRYSDF
jgi:hypothetical protein